MKLLDFLFFIDKYSKHQFDISFEKQAAYMLSLGFPKDDIDRSISNFYVRSSSLRGGCDLYGFLYLVLLSLL